MAAQCGGPARPARALVFGAHITGLAVLRALGRAGIPAFVAGGGTSLVARSRWYRPAPGPPPPEEPSAAPLAEYLERLPHARAVLFPCSDTWAAAVAALPPDVAERFPGVAPSAHAVDTLTRKDRFAVAARRLCVAIPRTLPVWGPEDLEALSDDELPHFFLKPIDSQHFTARFGLKGLPLGTRAEAAAHITRLAAEDVPMVLQEFIPGPATAHVFLDGYVDRHGDIRGCLARRRLRMNPPELGNSTLSATIPMAQIAPARAALERLLEGLDFRGALFDAEFKHDERDDTYKVLEVNARPWWQLEIAGAAGLPVVAMAYADALGLPVPRPDGYEIGRTWIHPQLDAGAWWIARRDGRPTGPSPPRAFFAGANALFAWDDPGPLGEEVGRLARRAGERLRGRRRR